MSRLVSAEEARKLLDGIPDAPLVKYKDEAWRDDAGDLKYAASFNRLYPGYREMFLAAPALAATVIALTAERDSERANGNDLADAVVRLEAERERLLSIRDDLVTDLGRQHAKLREHRAAIVVKMNQDGATLAMEQLAQDAAAVEKERDRLREVLACERGERAPEGWEWCLVRHEAWSDDFDDEGAWVWCRGRDTRIVRSAQTGRWMAWTLTPGLRNSWDGQAPKDHLPTALEAIEAADRAAKEAK